MFAATRYNIYLPGQEYIYLELQSVISLKISLNDKKGHFSMSTTLCPMMEYKFKCPRQMTV